MSPLIKLSPSIAATRAETEVVIVGAGAAGLMAGYELQKQGISYRILEATNRYGGRVRKAEGFADFPIDIGAEWIHTDVPYELFADMVDDDDVSFDEAVVPYDPEEFFWEAGKMTKEPAESYIEYKFKNTTWFDFLDKYIVPDIRSNILLNSPVTKIDYSGETTIVTTKSGETYEADQVLVTVPMGVLKANMIDFVPALPTKKAKAIKANPYPPGLKVFIKFTNRFYPDAVAVNDSYYYDAAYRKDANSNVLALFIVGEEARVFTDLPNEAAIMKAVLAELDSVFEGKATENYVNHIVQNWSTEPYVRGSYSHNESHKIRKRILEPLDGKVFFAGEALNQDFYSTVDGAGFSALSVLEEMMG